MAAASPVFSRLARAAAGSFFSLFFVTALTAGASGTRAAMAQAAPVISVNGPNPYIIECGVQTYQEFGATVSGGTGSLSGVTISGAPTGNHEPGQYTVTYQVTDAAGYTATAVRTVLVRDTIAPSVQSVVAENALWPPNHNLMNVGFTSVIHDLCDDNPTVKIAVFANERDEEQTGDGNFSPDAKNIAQNSLRLRAERKGDGEGRVYLIVVTAVDASGNVGFSGTTVTVAHDQSKASLARVQQLAAAARALTPQFAGAVLGASGIPAGFYQVGIGPLIGPKQ